jgi:hypothetical protein
MLFACLAVSLLTWKPWHHLTVTVVSDYISFIAIFN